MGNDFTLLSAMPIITFFSGSAANTDSKCIDISIIADDIYEENQVFSVSIDSVSLTTAAMIGTPNSVTITIQDNNGLLQLFLDMEHENKQNTLCFCRCCSCGTNAGDGCQ